MRGFDSTLLQDFYLSRLLQPIFEQQERQPLVFFFEKVGIGWVLGRIISDNFSFSFSIYFFCLKKIGIGYSCKQIDITFLKASDAPSEGIPQILQIHFGRCFIEGSEKAVSNRFDNTTF